VVTLSLEYVAYTQQLGAALERLYAEGTDAFRNEGKAHRRNRDESA
jgi:hypothetical protein